jgi:hypothetical protein
MQPESRKQKTTQPSFLHIIVPFAELKKLLSIGCSKRSWRRDARFRRLERFELHL